MKKLVLILVISTFVLSYMPVNISMASVDVSAEINSVTVNQPTAGELKTTIGKVLGFLQVASGLTSILVIAFTGFNYIVAETPNMKDELKKKMLPIVIGLVLVFSAVSISKFIIGSIEGATDSQGGGGGGKYLMDQK